MHEREGSNALGAQAGQKMAMLATMDERGQMTLRQNIDAQIKQTEARLEELHATKARMETSGILDQRIDDLSRAMRF